MFNADRSNSNLRSKALPGPVTPARSGFSLVEMLVAIVLGVGLLTLLLQLFISSKQNYTIQETLGRMQENARHAIESMTYDLRMAGFMGELQQHWFIANTNNAGPALPVPTLAVGGECFSGGQIRWAVPFYPQGTRSSPKIVGTDNSSANFTACVTSYRAATDIISAHYVGPDPLAPAGLAPIATVPNGIYLKSNLTTSYLFTCNAAGCEPTDWPAAITTAQTLTTAVYPVRAATYYVDTFNNLNRVRLNNNTADQEIVAEGIISMQVEYGTDPDLATADVTGPARRYVTAATLNNFNAPGQWANWTSIRTVRIWLLLSTLKDDPTYSGPTSYTLAGQVVSANTRQRHQLFVTTIAVRNPTD